MNNRLNLKNLTKHKLEKNFIPKIKVDNETSRFFKTYGKDEEKQDINNCIAVKNLNPNEPTVNNSEFTERLKVSNASDNILTFHSSHISNGNDKNEKWIPYNWEKQLNNVKQMRRSYSAPVDVMGCQKCVDKFDEAPVFRFQSLVALMLSSQTKDQVTFEAMKRLKQKNCIPQTIVSMPDEELEKLIYPVSFWKRKTQYLKRTARILLDDYDSDIPKSVEDLRKLPGVGPKIAHICMQVAWNKISGIGVDTHVHRISNRLKWVPKPTSNPEDTRIALERWLPRQLWAEINLLFVGFGQEVCQPRNPKCMNCLNSVICPYAKDKYNF